MIGSPKEFKSWMQSVQNHGLDGANEAEEEPKQSTNNPVEENAAKPLMTPSTQPVARRHIISAFTGEKSTSNEFRFPPPTQLTHT